MTQLDSKNVEGPFVKGQPLYETEGYKIHASRREGPGMAESVRDTDIIYVLSGSATIVTAGTVIARKTVMDGEIRTSSIGGGQPLMLVKGDVMVESFRILTGP